MLADVKAMRLGGVGENCQPYARGERAALNATILT